MLRMGMAPGRDHVPADLLPFWGPEADSAVFGLCYARIAGTQKTHRIEEWSDWGIHSIPKSRRTL